MTAFPWKRGRIEITDDEIRIEDRFSHILPIYFRDLYRKSRLRFLIIAGTLIGGLSYLFLSILLSPDSFPWMVGVSALMVLMLMLGFSEAKRLRPSVSTAGRIPREAIDRVYYSEGGRFHNPRFVIEVTEDGRTKRRLVDFNPRTITDQLAVGRRAFEEMGIPLEGSPPPISLLGVVQRDIENKVFKTRGGEESASQSEQETRISRWWLGVAIPVIFDLLLRIGRQTALVQLNLTGDTPWATLGFTLFSFVLLFLFLPLVPISMFLDAWRIRSSDADWNPNPVLWGLFGVLPIVALVYTGTLLTLPVGLIYLARRYVSVELR